MSAEHLSEEEIVASPRWGEFVRLLDDALKPECQSCGWAANFVCSLSVDMVRASAKLTYDGNIIGYDPYKAVIAMFDAKDKLWAITEDCPGAGVEETDLDFLNSVFKNIGIETPVDFPLQESCQNLRSNPGQN